MNCDEHDHGMSLQQRQQSTDRTLIRVEEGPNVLAHPLQFIWLKQICYLLWKITPWVDTIGATVAIFEFPLRTSPNSQN